MKRIISQFFVFISLALIVGSCQKAPFVTMNTPRSFTFTRDGGTQNITFTCNRDWSVSSSESWIQVSPSSGTAKDGEITVKISCAANTTYDPRSAVVTVKVEELSEAISISQDTGLGLIVSPKTFELTNAEQTIEIEVQKNVQYSVAIDNESAAWIKQGGTKALTTDKITFTISANTSYDNREGKIVFKQLDGNLSETVTVRQSQTNGLFITTPEYSLSNEAHTLSVEVKANVEFEVTSQADWITYVETKALKASSITLSIPANDGYDNRTGTVLVKQKNGDLTGTITITQKQTDYLEVTPTSFDLDNKQHEIELKVTQNVDYSVVIPDDAKSWVYVPTKASTKGLVDDRVLLVIDANSTYDDRETSITIKQDDGSLAATVAIKQAYGEGLIVEKTEYEIGQEGGTVEVNVQANVEYEVSSEVGWIHYVETKALTGSTVTLSIDENSTPNIRTGAVILKQKSGSLNQTITIKQGLLPKVETLDADEVLYQTAGFLGRITIAGEDISSLTVKFYYSKDFNMVEGLKQNGSIADGIFRDDLGYFVHYGNSVIPATTYYYMASVIYQDKEYFGNVVSFKTKEMSVSVTTHDASSITLNSSIISGNIKADSERMPDVCFFYSDTYSSLDDLVNHGTQEWVYMEDYPMYLHNYHYENNITKELKALKPATKYYYVLAAIYNNIYSYDDRVSYYGEVKSFTTKTDSDFGEAVDLGLSVKWRSCNIGASAPEDYGTYYAWGETTIKDDISWDSYKWIDKSTRKLTKYNYDSTRGTVDNKYFLEAEDDVASVKLGGNWRIPTMEEWESLQQLCTWTWTTRNGVSGQLVTSNKNGASIFLPASGFRDVLGVFEAGVYGSYWSSTISTSLPFNAMRMHFRSNYVEISMADRYYGFTIRPVLE